MKFVEQNTQYQTLKIDSEGLYTESGSRFIAYCYRVEDEDVVKQIKEKLRKEHHKAVHVAWACRIGLDADVERFSDDGEPSGSAGRPILNELKSRSLTQCAVFVVRYFGGKKLGIPGLIHAYGAAAADGIEHNQIVIIPIQECYKVTCSESDMHMVIHEINKAGARITDTEFGETCNFMITFNSDKHDKIIQKMESIWQIEVAFSHRF